MSNRQALKRSIARGMKIDPDDVEITSWNIEDGKVCVSGKVHSQTRPDGSYLLAQEFDIRSEKLLATVCTCPACSSKYAVVRGMSLCKHAVALAQEIKSRVETIEASVDEMELSIRAEMEQERATQSLGFPS